MIRGMTLQDHFIVLNRNPCKPLEHFPSSGRQPCRGSYYTCSLTVTACLMKYAFNFLQTVNPLFLLLLLWLLGEQQLVTFNWKWTCLLPHSFEKNLYQWTTVVGQMRLQNVVSGHYTSTIDTFSGILKLLHFFLVFSYGHLISTHWCKEGKQFIPCNW